MELINILIRTSNRKELFLRCLDSVLSQPYTTIRIIVSVDNPNVNYVPQWAETIEVEKNDLEYGYDLYLNHLKELVTEGWFMILDDDDYLLPDCLSQVVLDAPVIIHKLNHMGNIIPKKPEVSPGQIGMPCFMIHHSLKNVVDFTGGDHGDYHFAKELSEHVEFVYRDLILVECDRKGCGL